VQTWGGGVRVIDQGHDHDDAFATVADDARSGQPPTAATGGVAVPDLLADEWEPAPAASRPVPRVPLEELSFWDLFPEDLPPSRRPGAVDDGDWALEDQEDVLIGPGDQAPPPSAPPPPVPNPWGDDPLPGPAPAAPAAAAAAAEEDNLLLTELLDLSPAATQAANAAHYGNLIEAGGGDVGGRDEEDGDDEGDGGATARSGSGPRPPGSGSGTRKPRPKGSGKRRRKPGGGPGGPSGGSGGAGGGGGGSRPGDGGGAGTLGG